MDPVVRQRVREASVPQLLPKKSPTLRRLAAGGLILLLTLPAYAFDFPLTSSAIRDAYFLGTRQTGLEDFFAAYTHSVPALSISKEFVTRVRLETPFTQVVDHVSKTFNYSAQDAARDFYGKPAVFRMHLEIC
jgi:hypothetical protein